MVSWFTFENHNITSKPSLCRVESGIDAPDRPHIPNGASMPWLLHQGNVMRGKSHYRHLPCITLPQWNWITRMFCTPQTTIVSWHASHYPMELNYLNVMFSFELSFCLCHQTVAVWWHPGTICNGKCIELNHFTRPLQQYQGWIAMNRLSRAKLWKCIGNRCPLKLRDRHSLDWNQSSQKANLCTCV